MPADTPPPEYIDALIELHRGLPREGPGDTAFARQLLRSLPPLPARPRIADLGCGSGAGALLLAAHFGVPVRAVDTAAVLLDELRERAAARGLAHLITPMLADMGALDWPPASLDLLWSEGAAYSLGFEQALTRWRPLLAAGGVAVVSEMSWFTDTPPAAARDFWAAAYPTMGTESENERRARRAGYQPIDMRRLPAACWWTSYYGPLRARIAQLAPGTIDPAVLRETAEEMALFEAHSDAYGYVFYILAAA
jgi:SAM-dependent methyltransferase